MPKFVVTLRREVQTTESQTVEVLVEASTAEHARVQAENIIESDFAIDPEVWEIVSECEDDETIEVFDSPRPLKDEEDAAEFETFQSISDYP